MRKILFTAIVIGMLAVIPAIAQEIPEDQKSEFYYINVPIEKVFMHQKGYAVQYRTGTTKRGMAYIPVDWFKDPGGKGDLIYLSSGTQWPYLTVFYKNGEFDHLRLYIREERTHETWGNIPSNAKIDDRFEVEEITLEF
jgi:hypothetical protein